MRAAAPTLALGLRLPGPASSQVSEAQQEARAAGRPCHFPVPPLANGEEEVGGGRGRRSRTPVCGSVSTASQGPHVKGLFMSLPRVTRK